MTAAPVLCEAAPLFHLLRLLGERKGVDVRDAEGTMSLYISRDRVAARQDLEVPAIILNSQESWSDPNLTPNPSPPREAGPSEDGEASGEEGSSESDDGWGTSPADPPPKQYGSQDRIHTTTNKNRDRKRRKDKEKRRRREELGLPKRKRSPRPGSPRGAPAAKMKAVRSQRKVLSRPAVDGSDADSTDDAGGGRGSRGPSDPDGEASPREDSAQAAGSGSGSQRSESSSGRHDLTSRRTKPFVAWLEEELRRRRPSKAVKPTPRGRRQDMLNAALAFGNLEVMEEWQQVYLTARRIGSSRLADNTRQIAEAIDGGPEEGGGQLVVRQPMEGSDRRAEWYHLSHAWQELEQGRAEGIVAAVRYRMSMARLAEVHARAVETLEATGARGTVACSEPKVRLFHWVFEQWKYIPKPGTDPLSKKDWNRFDHALKGGRRWLAIMNALGRSVLTLIPKAQVPDSFVERGMRQYEFEAWLALIPRCRPGLVELAAVVGPRLTRFFHRRKVTAKRLRLELAPMSALKAHFKDARRLWDVVDEGTLTSTDEDEQAPCGNGNGATGGLAVAATPGVSAWGGGYGLYSNIDFTSNTGGGDGLVGSGPFEEPTWDQLWWSHQAAYSPSTGGGYRWVDESGGYLGGGTGGGLEFALGQEQGGGQLAASGAWQG